MKLTKYENGYNLPDGLTEDNYYEMLYMFIDLAKVKGLTVRQAQKLFNDCADAVMDTKLNGEHCNNAYLKSVSESLNKIANRGIDTYIRCSSTNN